MGPSVVRRYWTKLILFLSAAVCVAPITESLAGYYGLGAFWRTQSLVSTTISLEVPIEMMPSGVGSLVGSTYTAHESETNLNTADYDGTVAYVWEIVAVNGDSSAKTVTLIDSSGATKSTISVGAGTTAVTRSSTSWTPNAGTDSYRIQTQGTTNPNDLSVYSSRLIVRQQGATKTRIYIPFMTSQEALVNTPDVLFQNGSGGIYEFYGTLWKKNAGAFATLDATNPWTFETAIDSNGHTCNAALFDTAGHMVAASETTATSGYFHSVNIPDSEPFFTDGSTFKPMFKSDGGYNCSFWKAGLWVRLTGLSRGEVSYRMMTTVDAWNSCASRSPDGVCDLRRMLLDTSRFTSPTVYFEAAFLQDSGTASLLSQGADSGFAGAVAVTGSSLTSPGVSGGVSRSGALTIASPTRIYADGGTSDGDGILSAQVIVTFESNAPTITSVSPTAGAGGSTITLTGTHFDAGTVAKVGGVSCAPSTYVNPTTMTCVVPAQTSVGVSPISATSSAGTGTLSEGFIHLGAPALWLNASAGVTSSGGLISAWADQSGSGNHANQGNSGNRPTWVASSSSFSNQPVVRFAGAQYMTLTNLTPFKNVGEGSWAFAALTTDKTRAENLFSYSSGSAPGSGRFKASFNDGATEVGSAGSGDIAISARRLDSDGIQKVSGGTLANDVAFAAAGSLSWATRTATLRVNGATVSTSSSVQSAGNTDNTTSADARIGDQNGSAPFYGDIAEGLLYTKALTVAEMRAIECYFGSRYDTPVDSAAGCGPGTFAITGVTNGGTDTVADHLLVGGTTATINWNAAANAASYDVTLYQADGTTVQCAKVSVAAPATSYTFSGCPLTDGTFVQAKISARRGGVMGGAVPATNNGFWFLVGTAPSITSNSFLSSGLVANFDAMYADGGTAPYTPGCGGAQQTWKDLAGTHDGTLVSFSSCDATLGWNGTGTAADPYRLKLAAAQRVSMSGTPAGYPTGTSARTMCGWARLEGTPTGWEAFFSYGTGNTGAAMFVGKDGNSSTGLVGSAWGAADDILYANFWTIGAWGHVCLTYDGTTANLYGNGKRVNSVAKTWNLVADKAYIGANADGGSNWSGSIANVQLYSRALTAGEVWYNCYLNLSRFQGASCD